MPRIFRRRRQAAVVAVWSGGELLFVRHSYRPGYALPGGGARWRESLEEAACRELREEVGVAAEPSELEPVFTTIPVRIFEYTPAERPEIRIDNREIVEAKFADPKEMPDLPLYVRQYLLSRGGR